jgi:hypothetical protein
MESHGSDLRELSVMVRNHASPAMTRPKDNMTKNSSHEKLIGFLTVVEPSDGLLIGGYLILNPKGRPVEFHCTAPVQPNRAQQILYGASLRPYLCGERIGQALVGQSKHQPVLLCTDIADAMGLRERVSSPVILVATDDEVPEMSGREAEFVAVSLGATNARLHRADTERRARIEELWTHFDSICLTEPFGRIHEAVREAQRDAAA